MAVTLVSRPTTPNVTGTKLLFEVSGSDISHPQYSYVMDIYLSGSNERIDRQFQQPNPNGIAEFEPSQVLAGHLFYDNLWKITGSAYPTDAVKTFDLRFGEAYGTSTSSSITIYTGSSNNYLQVFPGVLDPNNVFKQDDISTYYTNGYNFYTASFTANVASEDQRPRFLTNHPAYSYDYEWIEDIEFVTKNDYLTITELEDTISGNVVVTGLLQVGNNTSFVLSTADIPSSNPEFPNRRFVTYPIGPKNLMESRSIWNELIESGSVNLIRVQDYPGAGRNTFYIRDNVYNNYVNPTDVDDQGSRDKPLPNDEDSLRLPLNKEYLQFAFVNKFGFYDYYNIYSPLKRRSEVFKNIVSLPKVDYSGTVSTYSYETGGDYDYNRETKDYYSISTQWLGKTKANWLEELLESPEVFVRQGDNYVPIVITNTEYQHNNSEGRNKLFQYTIDFVPSNGREIVQETYTDKTINTTKWTSKWYNGLSAPIIAPELDRTGFGLYSPYWRVGNIDVSYFFQYPPWTGSRQQGPNDFIYQNGNVPFDTVLVITGSEASTTASMQLDIYGDDNIVFSTSSIFTVDSGLAGGDFYTHFFPYTASFTDSYYENIVWSGSLGKYTWPISASLYRLNPYWVGTGSLDNSYNLTLTDSYYSSSSIANIQRPIPIRDDISVTSYSVPYATLKLQPDFTIPNNIPVKGILQITGSGTLVSGSITQSIDNSTTGSWVVQGIDATTKLNMAVNESLPGLDGGSLRFWYNSKDPGATPSTYWEDSKSNGPDLQVVNGAIFDSSSYLPILTGSVYDLTSTTGSPFAGGLNVNALSELNGSGHEIASFQAWVRFESGSLNNGFFFYGGTSVNTNKVDFIGVGTRASGSKAVLSIHGEYQGNPDIEETFPDLVLEPDTWYQVTLTRNGTRFNQHKLYLDNSAAYSPTNPALIEMGTAFIGGTGFQIANDFRYSLQGTGYISQFIYYNNREIGSTAIQTNYDALKVWLETEI